MIRVQCPNNNLSEREYIIKTLLQDFLGLEIEIVFSNQESNYVIMADGHSLIIRDCFWNKYPDDMTYYSLQNIPDRVSFACDELLNVPIIFGEDSILINDESVYCGVDIFASSFFMLTRWEEFLLGRERTGTCDENLLFAVKNKLQKRPIVNEYLELLKVLLGRINILVEVKNTTNVYITHDVDRCDLSSFGVLIKNLFPLAFKKKCYKKAINTFFDYISFKIKRKNPFDSFQELMAFSEKMGLKNYFFFKACVGNEKGCTYELSDSIVVRTLRQIIEKGHFIGFHPSENTYNNEVQFDVEYSRLKDALAEGVELIGGRNHELLYNQNTLNQWNNRLAFDSGFGYQYSNGFRCGCCLPFRVFHIVDRRTLNLKEIPFVAMDSVAIRNKWTPEEHYADVRDVVDIVKKYNGTICINYHSNLVNAASFNSHKSVYFSVLNYIVHGNVASIG